MGGMPHTPRSYDSRDYATIWDYFKDQPLGEVGTAIIEIEMEHPTESFEKRRVIASRLGFSPGYYRENLDALFELPEADRDYPAEMEVLRARRGRA